MGGVWNTRDGGSEQRGCVEQCVRLQLIYASGSMARPDQRKANRMGADWETIFASWAQPPSEAEKERSERVIGAIRTAVSNSPKLRSKRILVFPQGSYRNRVNVRRESDVDVGVMLYEYFLDEYPHGKTRADYGNHNVDYTFSQFKGELEEALVSHFGQAAVKRGNKAFDIKATAARVEADVVPLFEFRQYWAGGDYRAGVALIPDAGGRRIENYPERLVEHWPRIPLHYENGVSKNEATQRRFKGMVRILKMLRIKLAESGNIRAAGVPGYLAECLVWNAPDWCFEYPNWVERVDAVLRFLWANTTEHSLCAEWCEVDGIKYLFHGSQPWTLEQANAFIVSAADYVGVGPV